MALSVSCTVGLVLLTLGCWWAWQRLDRSELIRSKMNAAFLEEDDRAHLAGAHSAEVKTDNNTIDDVKQQAPDDY